MGVGNVAAAGETLVGYGGEVYGVLKSGFLAQQLPMCSVQNVLLE